MNKTRPGIIVLLTDFGERDSYVAEMKGVILSRHPRCRLVDLTHAVDKFQIMSAAYLLWRGYRYFPSGTVFLGVVDPGVGSARRLLLARGGGRYFVGPDNGLFSFITDLPRAACYELKAKRGGKNVSAVFQGRDFLAPAAAELSLGRSLSALGRRIENPTILPQFFPRALPGGWEGSIIHIDDFGNLVSNLSAKMLSVGREQGAWDIRFKGKSIPGICDYYAEVPRGKALALWGSAGLLEVAVREGRAAQKFSARPGDKITAVRKASRSKKS